MNNPCNSKLTRPGAPRGICGPWIVLLVSLALPPAVQAQFTFTTNANNTITITGYTGPSGDVAIPDTITGLPVTSIGGWAFYSGGPHQPYTLTIITIPDSVTSIGAWAFAYCGLTIVTIPNSVTNIGDSAFYCCSLTNVTIPNGSIGDSAFFDCNLTTVTIGNRVTSIGCAAFKGCFGLASLLIGTNVTSIGDQAFYTCDRLTSVSIPYSVVSIGTNAFAYCSSLTSVTIPNGSIGDMAFYDCPLEYVSLGTNVTSIGEAAFCSCSGLTSITIPNGSIGDLAFAGCTSLASVNIGNSVTNIGSAAFYNCTSLASVRIPNSVRRIGEQAFCSCTSLTNVTIGSGVTNIGQGVFLGCDRLRAIAVDALNAAYSCTDGVLFNKNQTTLVECPAAKTGSYTIPNSVTSIGDSAFYGCPLTNVTIPNSVTNIGVEAFYWCRNLTNVTIPKGVTCIANGTFGSCGLTSVTIPNSVTNIGGGAFYGCGNLTNLTIGTSVTSIGDYAFADTGLTSVTIPNSVTSIGDSAFAIGSLTSVYFEGNAPIAFSTAFLGDNAVAYYLPGTTGWGSTFGGLPTAVWNLSAQWVSTLPATGVSTNSATLNGTVNPNGWPTGAWFQWGATTNYGSFTSVTDLGSGTNALPLSAPLAGLAPSTTYHFRAAASDGGAVAFGRDQNFTTLGPPLVSTLPVTGVTTNSATLNATVNPNGRPTTAWFQWGTTTNYGSLTSVTDLGNGTAAGPLSAPLAGLTPYVTYHFRVAATNDYGLAYGSDQSFPTATSPTEFNYTITNGMVTITGYTGPGGAVTIPDTINGLPVFNIGYAAFLNCSRLTSVTIPDSVISIGDSAFDGCIGLTNVAIGNGVTSIAAQAFQSCNSLMEVTIPDGVASIGYGAFAYCGLTCVTIPDSVTNIEPCAIEGCPLTSARIGRGVTSPDLGQAFVWCSRLEAITVDTLNPTYSSVDGVLFNKTRSTLVRFGCPEGRGGSYAIPNGVTNIEDDAFTSCGSLTSVTIPNSVTSIGDQAFYFCNSLASITIPSSVTNIGNSAFLQCTSLSAITVDVLNPFYSSVNGVLFNKTQTTLLDCPGGKTGGYTIPSSVTSVEDEAFEDCTSLTSVTIPNSVITIGDWAFAGCTSLTNVAIPGSITNIAEYAFSMCTSLTNATIGNGVTTIGESAFGGCIHLASVSIGTSVTNIGNGAFAACYGLTSVTIPDSVTNIGDWAFENCTSLKAVYFQGNAPSVRGSSVFAGDSIATVYYLAGTTGWGSTFGGRPTAPWYRPNPVILDFGPSFGVQTNGFGFIISWVGHTSVVVEVRTGFGSPAWSPIATNILTGGSSYFSDPQWTNYPARFYRLSSP